MDFIMISIIIPAWNEEKSLPRLLKCIKKQTYKNYEIIVADANSKDKTIGIARSYGCRIVKSKGSPAVGRNLGAKVAKGSILLFMDADALTDNNFLEKSIAEFEKRNLDVAGSGLCSSNDEIVDKIFIGIFNFWNCLAQYFFPTAFGPGIYCRRWLHQKVKGFDKVIKLNEDMDYVRRCGKLGKFRMLKNSKVIFSMRRFENDGRFKTGMKLLLSILYRLFFGEIRANIFNYKSRVKRQ